MNRKDVNDAVKAINEEVKKNEYLKNVQDYELLRKGILEVFNNGITHASHDNWKDWVESTK